MSESSILFPQVQLVLNGVDLTPIPPKYLKEFRIISRLGTEAGIGYLQFEATLFDALFTEIDAALFSSPTGMSDVSVRYGYFDDQANSLSQWYNATITDIQPEFGKPFSYTITGISRAIAGASLNWQPKSYRGKISDVVKQIALEQDLIPDIEETDDDENAGDTDSDIPPRVWRTGSMNPLQFIKEMLLPRATSKLTEAGHYYLQVGEHPDLLTPESSKGYLIFKPVMMKKALSPLQEEIPTFKYLFGTDDNLISFRPIAPTKLLGAIGQFGLMLSTTDAKTKKYNPISLSEGSPTVDQLRRDDALGGPIEPPQSLGVTLEEGPDGISRTSENGSEVRVASPFGSDGNEVDRKAQAQSMWKKLYSSFFTATLDIVGRKEAVHLYAGRDVRILVILPDGSPHYTSGVYTIQEAVHEIAGSYVVRCQLFNKRSLNLS